MPLAPLFSWGAPTARVLPSELMADAFPAWPVRVPPQPKCASSDGFEALRYASCFNCPATEEPEGDDDCDWGYATPQRIIAAKIPAKRVLGLMPPPSQ